MPARRPAAWYSGHLPAYLALSVAAHAALLAALAPPRLDLPTPPGRPAPPFQVRLPSGTALPAPLPSTAPALPSGPAAPPEAEALGKAESAGEVHYFQADEVDIKALVYRPPGRLTPLGEAKGELAGEIVLRLRLAADGRIVSIDAQASDLPPSWVAAAISGFRTAVFSPAWKDGRPVPSEVRIAVMHHPSQPEPAPP